MRLRQPTVQRVESEDGLCSLTYERLDEAPAQAGGGAMYLLRVSQPGGVVEIRGTVQVSSQPNGHSAYVILFMYGDELKGGPTRKIQNEAHFSELFCKMFLRLTAAYEYNNSDYPGCGDGHYTDTIDYEPWGVDPNLIRSFTADWAFSSNLPQLLPVPAARRRLLGVVLDLWRARRP